MQFLYWRTAPHLSSAMKIGSNFCRLGRDWAILVGAETNFTNNGLDIAFGFGFIFVTSVVDDIRDSLVRVINALEIRVRYLVLAI